MRAEEKVELTPREKEALQYAADGYRTGDMPFCSAGTAKKHWNRAEQKLGADTIAHAVALAIRRGIIK